MPRYYRVKGAIDAAMPFLTLAQKTDLALLASAILKKRALCLSELARAYPAPLKRRVPAPKHGLLHRPKRLWRFTDNERADALLVQMALVPHAVARLGFPRLLGLAIDWTFFDTVLPSGERTRYQVSRIAVPRKGRALTLLQLAYGRDAPGPNKSQNRLEQDALLAVVGVLPRGVHPMILADRGFRRSSFIAWGSCATASTKSSFQNPGEAQKHWRKAGGIWPEFRHSRLCAHLFNYLNWRF